VYDAVNNVKLVPNDPYILTKNVNLDATLTTGDKRIETRRALFGNKSITDSVSDATRNVKTI
jgi:hypothetical protein